MCDILDARAKGARCVTVAAGETLLAEGKRAGKLFVLAEGEFEIAKGDVQIAPRLVHGIRQGACVSICSDFVPAGCGAP